MTLLVNISDTLYDRIINAKSVPDLNGVDIVNAIEAIKSGKESIGYWIERPIGFKCSNCLVVQRYNSMRCPNCKCRMVDSIKQGQSESEG